MVLGDAVSKLETFVCWAFEPCFKVNNLGSVYPKSMKLGPAILYNKMRSPVKLKRHKTSRSYRATL